MPFLEAKIQVFPFKAEYVPEKEKVLISLKFSIWNDANLSGRDWCVHVLCPKMKSGCLPLLSADILKQKDKRFPSFPIGELRKATMMTSLAISGRAAHFHIGVLSSCLGITKRPGIKDKLKKCHRILHSKDVNTQNEIRKATRQIRQQYPSFVTSSPS